MGKLVQAPVGSMTEQSKSTQSAGGFAVSQQSSVERARVIVVVPTGVETSVQTLRSPSKVPPTHTMSEMVAITSVEISGVTVTVSLTVTVSVVTVTVVSVVGVQEGTYGFRMVKSALEKQVASTPTAHRLVSRVHSVGVVKVVQPVLVLVLVLVLLGSVVMVTVVVQPEVVDSPGTQSASPPRESSQVKPQGQGITFKPEQFRYALIPGRHRKPYGNPSQILMAFDKLMATAPAW